MQSKNIDLLLTDIINFKLRLINFVYFFETSGIRFFTFEKRKDKDF